MLLDRPGTHGTGKVDRAMSDYTPEIDSKIADARKELSTLSLERRRHNREANELRKKIRERQYMIQSLTQAREELRKNR